MVDPVKAEALFRLDGRTVLVTGASSGIGRATAIACAQAGARLIACGRDPSRLKQVLDELPGSGHEIREADLSDIEQVYHVADSCDVLDGLVHSAGVQGLAPIRSLQAQFLQKVFQVNYVAPVLLTQRLLFKKKIRPGGSILFISSVAAKAGKVGVGPYSGSKAALLGTMRPLALELAKHRIRVNALCPGIVVTPIFAGHDEWLEEEAARNYPLGLGQPEDVAHSALFFLSNASSKITGVAFSIDGGVTTA